jgi:hypothetical protein
MAHNLIKITHLFTYCPFPADFNLSGGMREAVCEATDVVDSVTHHDDDNKK